ncbi:MAG: GIY-YIG nuclease family protein, partial [Myxococcales bacterium]|nr:GIY-YIG nuclease family protein [Myxococcales bacterium]
MFSLPLSETTVLVVDCQATGSGPGRSHLLEVAFALARASDAGLVRVTERLVRLPPGARLPPEAARLTGLDARALEAGVAPEHAWRELAAAAASLAPVTLLGEVPAVGHFARYEERFLRPLALAEARARELGGAPAQVSLAFVCTHAIARRLLPDLPRMTLRALTGYLGRAVGPLRRSGEHVAATAFVWRELVRALAAEAGVRHFDELAAWLRAPAPRSAAARAPRTRKRRVYPLARELRLGLPDLPGVYRLLRAGGDVLYVGKATSLKERVNDHFRGRGTHERALEMLSQARDLAVTVAASPLEAALLESDLIKAHDPPYNVALRPGPRPWFASPRALGPERAAGAARTLGPFAGPEPLARLAALRGALARAEVSADTAHAVLGMPERRAPEPACFAEGLQRFARRHELGAG